MTEIDVTNKAKFIIKYGLVGVLALTFVCASLVWYALFSWGNLELHDARISGNMVGVRASAPGRVTQVMVKNGDRVKAGDVIAKVEVKVTEEQLKQMEQTLELYIKNLEQIKRGVVVSTPRVVQSAAAGASDTEIANAKSKMDQMNKLFEMGAVSGVKRDEAKAEYEMLLASKRQASTEVTYETSYQPASPEVVHRAEQQVNQTRAALEMARTSAGATEIVATVDGMIYLNDVDEGSEIRAGDVVAYVGNDDDIWIEAYLTPAEAQYASLGHIASFFVDRKKYDGVIMEVFEADAVNDSENNTEGGYVNKYPAGSTVVRISVPPDLREGIHFGSLVDVRFSKI